MLSENEMTLEEISTNGAILKMNFNYNCELKFADCEPTITFDRLSFPEDGQISIEESISYFIPDGKGNMV